MRKIKSSFMILALSAFLLSSCGKKNDKLNEQNPNDNEATVVLNGYADFLYYFGVNLTFTQTQFEAGKNVKCTLRADFYPKMGLNSYSKAATNISVFGYLNINYYTNANNTTTKSFNYNYSTLIQKGSNYYASQSIFVNYNVPEVAYGVKDAVIYVSSSSGTIVLS